MASEFNIGDSHGAHQKVWGDDDAVYEVWVTSGGRYTVLDASRGYMSVKSNIRTEEDAIYEARKREGTLSSDESKQVVLHGVEGRRISERETAETLSGEDFRNLDIDPESADEMLRELSKRGVIKNGVVGREIGDKAYGGHTFLGQGDDFQVWMTPSRKKYQVTRRNPEEPYSAAISKERLDEILKGLPSETPYQQMLPGFE